MGGYPCCNVCLIETISDVGEQTSYSLSRTIDDGDWIIEIDIDDYTVGDLWSIDQMTAEVTGVLAIKSFKMFAGTTCTEKIVAIGSGAPVTLTFAAGTNCDTGHNSYTNEHRSVYVTHSQAGGTKAEHHFVTPIAAGTSRDIVLTFSGDATIGDIRIYKTICQDSSCTEVLTSEPLDCETSGPYRWFIEPKIVVTGGGVTWAEHDYQGPIWNAGTTPATIHQDDCNVNKKIEQDNSDANGTYFLTLYDPNGVAVTDLTDFKNNIAANLCRTEQSGYYWSMDYITMPALTIDNHSTDCNQHLGNDMELNHNVLGNTDYLPGEQPVWAANILVTGRYEFTPGSPYLFPIALRTTPGETTQNQWQWKVKIGSGIPYLDAFVCTVPSGGTNKHGSPSINTGDTGTDINGNDWTWLPTSDALVVTSVLSYPTTTRLQDV